MDQEYPFRPRGKHGFDREDVINYISQAQQRCNEHLARMEELEAAKNAWYTQAKGMEREKTALVARNRELEEQLERGAAPAAGEWLQADPMLASFEETQETAALRARCLELEERLEQQNIQQSAQQAAWEQELAEAREAAGDLRGQLDSLRAQMKARDDELPRFTLHQQEAELLRAQLEQENFALEQKLAALENERSAFSAQMPALQEQLTRLAESAEKITSLEAAKAALAAELEAARQAQAALRQERDSLAAEAEALRAQLKELEGRGGQPNEDALRSMVLASFNYSNLYVDNNLKTAQFISEATSRNIGRVSDSASSLLEQLDAIARSFNDTTDGIRRNLASFQRELGTIQSGMNRRLSQDRFAALLEENERLRTQLEQELFAELSSEEEEPAPLPAAGEPAQLPFAEDLPQNYHEYLDN